MVMLMFLYEMIMTDVIAVIYDRLHQLLVNMLLLSTVT